MENMNGKSRLQQVQGDVEEVRDIMLDNFNKADERNYKLVELEDRADELLEMVSGRGITENIFGKSVGRMEKVKGRIHQKCYIRALKKGNSQTAEVQEPFGLFLKCSASPVNISILTSGQIIIIVCVSATLRSLSGYRALHPGSLSLPRCCCL
uniref:V-SNARE coiled-coil homology domain-containing protein n=1 Tax=Gasterosteus aculeatus aculeatus TaxID=481459 RepID=A0AAQ4QSF9_GASAC